MCQEWFLNQAWFEFNQMMVNDEQSSSGKVVVQEKYQNFLNLYLSIALSRSV